MPTAEARIDTARPSRYLVQFCRHAAAMAGPRHRPRIHGRRDAVALREVRVHAEWSETNGEVDFSPWGRCTLAANADALVLRVEAADEDKLRRIQEIITRNLGKFGRRDNLAVRWHRPDTQLANGSAA